jgi:MFS family permease
MKPGSTELEDLAWRNVRSFTLFRVFFSARFYYPVYALLFLDHGLTLGQFGVLNGIWAATIVLLEVPSGALADTIGRRRLLMVAALCMVLEMIVLLVAPIGGGFWLFALFACNRVLSGAAEAAASGADEALTYDSLMAAGLEHKWGHVLERVQRDTSLAFFFAMMLGAAVYDPRMVNAVLQFFGASFSVEQSQLVKMPIVLTFLSSLVVLSMAWRMREPPVESKLDLRATVAGGWQRTAGATRWIWSSPWPFAIILAALILDSPIRQFLVLASEYWKTIELPIASYGLIGSGMALMGLFVPRLARLLAERQRPLVNFGITGLTLLVGLAGIALAIPFWGILPAVLIFAAMQMSNFFVSRYLNETADSEQRATVLSFRGLSTNFSYGLVSLLYSGLVVMIKTAEGLNESGSAGQEQVFVASLQWFPWYLIGTALLALLIHRLRFGGAKG